MSGRDDTPPPVLWRLEYLRNWPDGQPAPIHCIRWFTTEAGAIAHREDIARAGRGEVLSLVKYRLDDVNTLSAVIRALEVNTLSSVMRAIETAVSGKFENWDLYRAAAGGWHFIGRTADGQRCDLEAAGIPEALVAAMKWRPLPTVPRPVKRVARADFVPRKRGSHWKIDYRGQTTTDLGFPTKSAAEAWADKMVDDANRRADLWRTAHGWTEGKVEGVDFRYID